MRKPALTREPVLTTQGLVVGYPLRRQRPVVVADRLSLTLTPGELVCLIGPNGTGKSTLLRTLAGVQPPLDGQLSLMGDRPSRLKPRELARRLSIVLTEQVSVGDLSAQELVGLGRYPYTDWSGKLSPADWDIVRWAIQCVGAEDLSYRSVSELSDGERQKVMIARALAQDPVVLILDEPTAFLDLPRRVEIMHILKQLARSTEKAVLLSTHDLELALRNADRIWLMPSQGELQQGAPEDLVLSGAFKRTFQGEGIEFDSHAGSFRIQSTPGAQIDLVGDGLHALWTQRALERIGCVVVRVSNLESETSSVARVVILPESSKPSWRVALPGSSTTCRSLYELASLIDQHTRKAPDATDRLLR